MQATRVSTIDFREGSGSDVPSVEILIDGRHIAEIISPHCPDAGIPLSIITGPDLPSLFDDGHYATPDDGQRIVAVCSCGIPGCGASSAQFVIEGDLVRISLRSVRSISGSPIASDLADFVASDETFWVSSPDYREFLDCLWSYVTDPSHEATEPTGIQT